MPPDNAPKVGDAIPIDAQIGVGGAIPEGATIGDTTEQPGLLQRAWHWLNKPVADNLLPEGMSTKDVIRSVAFTNLFHEPYVPGTNDFDTKAQQHFGHSPTKDAVKTFISGTVKDASDLVAGQTSPIGIATMAGGALTKAPGAVGTLARIGTGAASAGFAGKGAADVIGAGTENTPEAWQQRLQGGAMVAGGAAGVGATRPLKTALSTAGKAIPESVPERMYESALKPSTTLPAGKRAQIIRTGLENEIPVSAEGAAKLSDLLNDVNQKIADKIHISNRLGATVDPLEVSSRLGDVGQQFVNQVNPEADLAAIQRSGEEFLRTQPSDIPIERAQQLKQGTYQQLRKKYGQLGSADIESQKALARGLKEEIANQLPEINELNAQDSKFINLDQALERAVARISNHQLLGIGTPITGGAVGVVTKSSKLGAIAGTLKAVIDDPGVKSRIAIALSRKGIPLPQAQARLAAYSALLSSAASNVPVENRTNEQGQE